MAKACSLPHPSASVGRLSAAMSDSEGDEALGAENLAMLGRAARERIMEDSEDEEHDEPDAGCDADTDDSLLEDEADDEADDRP